VAWIVREAAVVHVVVVEKELAITRNVEGREVLVTTVVNVITGVPLRVMESHIAFGKELQTSRTCYLL
jgi:endonuclease/exonuclease/phosphatase family metal-dependent hydrolase